MKSELSLPSDLKYLPVVENWLIQSLKSELGECSFCETNISRLRLALTEAYANVVIHAHKKQSEIPIYIHLEIQNNELTIKIWDSGNGFDINTYKPPQPQNIQEGGYGWLIINRLMDEVEYTLHINGRNCLKMQKKIVEK